MRQFYLKYFTATEGLSWLACPSAPQRLKMLEELMQWEVTARPRISELQTSCVTEYWCRLYPAIISEHRWWLFFHMARREQ